MSQSGRVVLASQSPARAGLLRRAGIEFDAVPAGIDEAAIKAEWISDRRPLPRLALELALRKAEAVALHHPDAVVVGADQLLVFDGASLDKPSTMDEARARLTALRGHAHRLVTAMTVCHQRRIIANVVETADLVMRPFSDRCLDSYLACEGDSVLASVGAYRIEGPGIQLFDRIDGDHDVILGLPVMPLLRALRSEGVIPS